MNINFLKRRIKSPSDMKKILLKSFILLMVIDPSVAMAAPVKQELPDALSNPYMHLMLALIFVLLLAIVVLNYSIQSVAIFKNNEKKNNDNNSGKTKATLTLALILISSYGFSQGTSDTMPVEEIKTAADWTLFGMTYTTFFALLACIIFEVIVIGFQLIILKGFIGINKPVKLKPIETTVAVENRFWKKINASVALEDEEEILFEHEYDGIKELDNNLPPWWKYGFYLTIVFAFVYMIHFHIAKSGALQEQEYLTEIEEGKKQVADNVDENTVEYLTDASDLSEGKGIYAANCVACHGVLGEGKVGPNLTDQYWIHSGGIKDIFYSIKYGWPDKGMKSWKDDLTPKQIAKVSSYIKSLVGSNPPNALEPKGELYKE
jgi:cytochrome c oxidase cbb3-type subunit III